MLSAHPKIFGHNETMTVKFQKNANYKSQINSNFQLLKFQNFLVSNFVFCFLVLIWCLLFAICYFTHNQCNMKICHWHEGEICKLKRFLIFVPQIRNDSCQECHFECSTKILFGIMREMTEMLKQVANDRF